MINCNRINEAVMGEMRRLGVGKKPVVESAMSDKDAENQEKANKPKRIDVKVTTKSDSWVTGFNGTLEEAKSYYMGKRFETRDEKPGDPVTSVTLVSGVKESQRSERKPIKEGYEAENDEKTADPGEYTAGKKKPSSPKPWGGYGSKEAQDRARANLEKAKAKKATAEGEDEKEGLEDKQFDAPTGKEIDEIGKKPEGVDKGHDEAGEEQDDPTREKLETPQDEKDEMKGGAAELAADLRVSVRIERMNMGRYKKMLDKHDLSEDGQGWLKEKIQDIQSMIDDMLERIPKLEAEAKGEEGGEEKIKECMRVALKKAIVEIAAG
jgi:hypothetical protein